MVSNKITSHIDRKHLPSLCYCGRPLWVLIYVVWVSKCKSSALEKYVLVDKNHCKYNGVCLCTEREMSVWLWRIKVKTFARFFVQEIFWNVRNVYFEYCCYKIFILNWPTTIVRSRCSFLYAYIILNKLDLLYQRSCAIKLDVLSSLAISGLHANQ